MRKVLYILLLGPILLLTSCATILGTSKQKVSIITPSSDAKIYVDDELVGTGDSIRVKIKKDLVGKQIRVERDGYLPNYKAHLQSLRSPLYIMSVVPFAVLIYPPLYDVGPKAWKYEKSARLMGNVKVQKKTPDLKYVYLKQSSFDVKKENFKYISTYSKRYYYDKSPYNEAAAEKDVKIDNSIFTDIINKSLKESGFIDTTKKILRNKQNTIYVNSKIEKINIYQVFSRNSATMYMPSFIVAEPEIKWSIVDSYDQEKYSKTLTLKSNEFVYVYNEDENKSTLIKALDNAIELSFHQLLNENEVQELLKITNNEVTFDEKINIKNNSLGVSNIEEAMSASITIKHKDGHGSGFFISEDGYLITNYHVIAGAKDIKVITNSGVEHDAEIIRSNEVADLSLLKITPKSKVITFKIPLEKNYGIGKGVYCVGTPTSAELGQTVSKGIISGVRKVEDLGFDWIQTDVSVNFGNSGGPLIKENGELLGVVNSKVVGMGVEGIAFAIPAKDIAELLQLDIK